MEVTQEIPNCHVLDVRSLTGEAGELCQLYCADGICLAMCDDEAALLNEMKYYYK